MTYGLHHPYYLGYGVRGTGTDPKDQGANASLTNQGGDKIHFYVHEVEANFNVVGTTAQSRLVRQFFPYSMSQVTMSVRGQAPSSYEYNRLASFVRGSQVAALSASGDPTIRFDLDGAGVATKRNTKGKHRRWVLRGYILKVAAGAERFNHAPSFEFDFVISQVVHDKGQTYGIFHDSAVQGRRILSWTTIINKSKKSGLNGIGFVADPTPAEDESKETEKVINEYPPYARRPGE